jgi:hypothetical protein
MEDTLCGNAVAQPNRVFSVPLQGLSKMASGSVESSSTAESMMRLLRQTDRRDRKSSLHSPLDGLTLPHGGLKPAIFGFLTLGDCQRIAAYASCAIASAVSSFSSVSSLRGTRSSARFLEQRRQMRPDGEPMMVFLVEEQ